jgi:pimeloyl-ACP methyl ester carboxylesterase
METKHHTLKDGRILAYAEFGAPDGCPVFYAHGGPGSRVEGHLFHEEACCHNYKIIATDRPGMGESTYLPNRKLLDYPHDIAELADALEINKFGVIGWSGGGAHTTVCGYAIPERLLFNLSFAGYTNFAEMPGAEKYLESKLDQMSVGLSKTHPRLFKIFFDLMKLSEKFIPESAYKALLNNLCEADKTIAKDETFKSIFMKSQEEAFKQGSQGVTTDAAVHYVDWGFKFKEISFKLHVFHGTEDHLVPFEYGKNISEKVPNCELHRMEGEGHLFPYKYTKLIFDTADSERAKLK